MNRITFENYRCFRGQQTVRLAPLTLLVGDNSTGKTSFLALIHSLWIYAFRSQEPDFKIKPGSFAEIAHYQGVGGKQANHFETTVAFDADYRGNQNVPAQVLEFRVTFGPWGAAAAPLSWKVTNGSCMIRVFLASTLPHEIQVETSRGLWQIHDPWEIERYEQDPKGKLDVQSVLQALQIFAHERVQSMHEEYFRPKDLMHDAVPFQSQDADALQQIIVNFQNKSRPVFADAPIRSEPRRTYDPLDPNEDYALRLLAHELSAPHRGQQLKERLENFGRDAGLFNEISINHLGQQGNEPFQVQVRKYDKRRKGPRRTLVDVGYGISQVLPVVMNLFRARQRSLFLLQQPEVHLHPSAQAALGSLMGQSAGSGHQLVVETHSDHLLNRVRMDIRDGVSALKPEDVSILWFERSDLDVCIHSIRIDAEGNIADAPSNYRRFFMDEMRRSLGI